MVDAPAVVIRPIESPPGSVNQRFPSAPAAIEPGEPSTAKFDHRARRWSMRPIELLAALVNHRFPSAPAVMSVGAAMPLPVNVVTTPGVVIRPIDAPPVFVNHRLPSGPIGDAAREVGRCRRTSGRRPRW